MPEQQVKAIAIYRLLENTREVYGAEAHERVVNRLPEELAKKARYGLLVPTAWVPISWVRATHAAIRKEEEASPDTPRQFGRRAGKMNFTTVHRAFLRVLAPEWVIARASRVYGQYVSAGTMRIVESKSGMVRAVFEGCVGYDRNIWQSTIGQCEAVLELCGARNVRVRIHEGGEDGDEHLELSAFWT